MYPSVPGYKLDCTYDATLCNYTIMIDQNEFLRVPMVLSWNITFRFQFS